MSRTVRGEKGQGDDFWSGRPHSGYGFGPDRKRKTHRTERQRGKREARDS